MKIRYQCIKSVNRVINLSKYQGDELELFENAINWKKYWSSKIEEERNTKGLEIGAGIGGNNSFLLPKTDSLTLCEPDEFFFQNFLEPMAESNKKISVVLGTIEQIESEREFDQIYYIDVLEHIEDDKQEILNATRHLKRNGSLYILVPAHKILYSEFDRSVGHFRRYNKKMITDCVPANFTISEYYCLDSLGVLASLGNKLFSRNSSVTLKKVIFWDKILVPLSIKIDRLTGYKFGKSILVKIEHV
jgi:hypothetical protein